MTPEALNRLVALANQFGSDIVDRWGMTSTRIAEPIEATLLVEAASVEGLTAVGYFGDSYLPLLLDRNEPDADDLAPIADLAPNERVAAELRAAATSVDVALMLVDQLVEIEVRFERRGWIRTPEAFVEAVDRDWLSVAEGLTSMIEIADRQFALPVATGATHPDRPPVYAPVESDSDDPDADLWQVLYGLADAAAWMNLAHAVDRGAGAVRIGLIADEPPRRLVTPSSSEGGSALLRWVTATEDANRREALDYVLTLVAAGSSDQLPNAVTVRRLADRQRIALSRDQAAEVQRAIADGQRDTANALHRASADFGSLVEETTTTANAAIIAVLGLVVFVAQEADRLPGWLIMLATVVAVVGIALVVASRWSRIGDNQASVNQLAARIDADPLLPADDRRVAAEAIDAFDVNRRAARARLRVTVLGAGAAVVAMSASAWLLWGSQTSSAPDGAPQNPTTSTSQGRP